MNNYSEKFEKMRIAGKLASQTLDMLTDHVKPGISTDKIDQLGYEFINDNGGHSAPLYYRGFKKSLCTSLNHVVCHGIPSERILNEGDVVNIDVTAIVNEYYGDTSRMYTVGEVSIKAKNLIDATYESMMNAIKILKSHRSLASYLNLKSAYIISSLTILPPWSQRTDQSAPSASPPLPPTRSTSPTA